MALPRSADLVVALVGVLRSGAAYLPLDLDYPADRSRYMLADAAPRCVVTAADLAGRCPRDRGRAAGRGRDRGPATCTPIAPADRRTPRTCIYTSGSTGRPKGVVVTHAGVAKLLASPAGRLGVGPDSRVLQFASPSFDLAFWELCRRCCPAARWWWSRPNAGCPARRWPTTLTQHGVTFMILPPALLAALPDAAAGCRTGATLLAGTERGRRARLAERLSRRRPEMFNAYGPTEATRQRDPGRATPTARRHRADRLRPTRAAGRTCWTRRCGPVPPGVVGRAVPRRAPAWPAATTTGRA